MSAAKGNHPGIRKAVATGTALAALGVFATLAIAGCLGGTGTDTENGAQPVLVTARVLTPDSAPVSGVQLEVLQAYSRADSALESAVYGTDTGLLTDASGYVTIQLKQTGAFVVKGASGDTVLFIDTLRAKISRSGVLTGGNDDQLFRTEEPMRASGRLRLLSGYRADSGRIALQGTRLLWSLGANGSYDLGWLPPSAEKMTLRVTYWASPGDSSAAASCVKPGANGANAATLSLKNGEIIVNDLAKGAGCPAAKP